MSQEITPTPKRNFFLWIFTSSDEPRLRAGWRLLIQTLLMIIIGLIIGYIIGALGIGNVGGTLGFLLGQVVELVVFGSSIYIARRFLDRRSFASLGLEFNKHTLMDILAGIGITFVLMGAIYLAEWSFGWLKFEAFAWQVDPINVVIEGVLGFFVIFIFVGFNEELLSRGYHLQTIASGTNLFWGVIISSSIFGLLHLGNPNATWVSTAGIFFAGIFLAYGYVRTKQLWLSMGMHLGWNFFEGVVFGFPVSGLGIYPLLRIKVTGPVIWTGGAFGPEAGLIVLPAMIIGAVLIYYYTANRNANI